MKRYQLLWSAPILFVFAGNCLCGSHFDSQSPRGRRQPGHKSEAISVAGIKAKGCVRQCCATPRPHKDASAASRVAVRPVDPVDISKFSMAETIMGCSKPLTLGQVRVTSRCHTLPPVLHVVQFLGASMLSPLRVVDKTLRCHTLGVMMCLGSLTLIGVGTAAYSLPALGEGFFNEGAAGLVDFVHAGGFAYFGALGPLGAGVGVFGKGTYDVANASNQYYANTISCAASVPSHP